MNQRIKVVYIASVGHSGSTLLDLMINNHPEVQSVGELLFLDQWLNNNLLCSCQVPIRDCLFWRDVLERVGGAANFRLNYPKLSYLRKVADEKSHKTVIGYKAHSGLVSRYYSLLDSVQHNTGAKIIVDSSKLLSRLKIYKEREIFDPIFILLSRNPLAVQRSHSTSREMPSYDDGRTTQVYSTIRSLMRWRYYYKQMQIFERQSQFRVLRVRYEDLCDNTESVLRNLYGALGLSIPENMAYPSTENIHNVAGSRWRYQSNVEISRTSEPQFESLNYVDQKIYRMLISSLANEFGYTL